MKIINMQIMIKASTVISMLACSLMTASEADTKSGSPKNEAMLFKPASGSMWDPSIIWHEGQFHLFAMLTRPGRPDSDSVLHATSSDGLHWVDGGAVITSTTHPDNRIWKMFVAHCGDRFIMDHGAFSQADGKNNDTLRFYESKDLNHWSFIGENHPDPKYYNPEGRWDHMYILPKIEENPAAGFWGYVVACPNQAMSEEGRGFGMMESVDGREWTQLPPEKVDCGRFPHMNALETGGCERLEGKYYLIGGCSNIMGQSSYSMFTLVSDSPTGPFKLDQDAWRLCGSSGYPGRWGVQFLAAFVRGNGEILISQYISLDKGVWLVPLKKAVVDGAGHLRMGYWKNNDAARGGAIALDAAACRLEYPHPKQDDSPALAVKSAGVESEDGRIKITPEQPKGEDHKDYQAIALLDTKFNLMQGVILEGTIKSESVGRERPQYAGFYIEEAAGKGVAVLLQIGDPSWRRSLIGNLSLTPKWGFEALDETGPGCATATGLDNQRKHTFRLWIKNNAFELYIDDILMQTFITNGMTGRLGVVTQNIPATFGDLKMWHMNLD